MLIVVMNDREDGSRAWVSSELIYTRAPQKVRRMLSLRLQSLMIWLQCTGHRILRSSSQVSTVGRRMLDFP